MRELIAKLEAVVEPDRELDAELDVLMFGGETIWKTTNYTMKLYPASRRPSKQHVGGYANEHVPHYTASIDAAVALAERVLRPAHPQMTVSLRGVLSTSSDYWFAEITWPSHERQGRHVSPAIALCIAILRAAEESAG